MKEAMQLAGHFAAHAVWCVSDGGPLIPLLAEESAAKGRLMTRFAADMLEDGAAQGQARLDANPEHAERAVLVYDGFATLPEGRIDALIVVIRDYAAPANTLTMALPYRPMESPEGFAVYRPKFIRWSGATEPDYSALADAFFNGLDSHQQGAAVWDKHSDGSL